VIIGEDGYHTGLTVTGEHCLADEMTLIDCWLLPVIPGLALLLIDYDW